MALFLLAGAATMAPVQASAQPRSLCDQIACAFTVQDFDSQSLDRQSIYNLLVVVIAYLVYIAIPVAALAIILGGGYLLFGKGEQGWNLIKNALYGLVIIILSATIVNVVTTLLI